MSNSPDVSPFDLGVKAYEAGISADDGNPFDSNESPDEWDEWIDGWATARLEVYLPWQKEVDAKMGVGARYAGDFNRYFDDGLTPDEAIKENRIEVEKQDARRAALADDEE